MEDHRSERVFEDMVLNEARFPGKNTFDLFLELISGFPVRSTFDYRGSDPFHSRWVSAQVGGGTAIRWSCASHATSRNENDVADSSASGLGILYALAGGARVVQGGKEIEVLPRCAVIYDLDAPARVDMIERGSNEFLFMTVPRDLAQATAPSADFSNPILPLSKRSPLLECVEHLSGVLSKKSAKELDYVYDACASLLVAEYLIAQNDYSSSARGIQASSDLLAQMMVQIDHEAGNRDLSPEWLAARFGVSVRYVHKLFAKEGMTCQSHINNVRLNYARKDLVCSVSKLRIATLAYRWGFTDPSAFGRAFRSRFGCSPGQFQSKVRS